MIKHLGLVCIVLVWVSTYALLRRHSSEPHKSISSHAAKNKTFYTLFGMAELAITVLFGVFLFGWFIPHLQLGAAFKVVAAIGLISTVIAAIIPERPGWQHTAHGTAAYTMATTLALSNVLLLNSPVIGVNAKIVFAISLAGMLCIAILSAQGKKGILGSHVLALQLLYYLMYHIAMLTATYTT